MISTSPTSTTSRHMTQSRPTRCIRGTFIGVLGRVSFLGIRWKSECGPVVATSLLCQEVGNVPKKEENSHCVSTEIQPWLKQDLLLNFSVAGAKIVHYTRGDKKIKPTQGREFGFQCRGRMRMLYLICFRGSLTTVWSLALQEVKSIGLSWWSSSERLLCYKNVCQGAQTRSFAIYF